VQHSTQPIDLDTASKVGGLVVVVIAVLRFIPPIKRWLHQRELGRVRALVEEAFSTELRRGEQSAAEILAVHDRLDRLEDSVARNAELLEQIPGLVTDVAEVKGDVKELRGDIKLVLQQLGQVQGRSAFPPLHPGSDQ